MTKERTTTINGFKAPISLADRLDNYSEVEGKSKTEIHIEALTEYFNKKAKKGQK